MRKGRKRLRLKGRCTLNRKRRIGRTRARIPRGNELADNAGSTCPNAMDCNSQMQRMVGLYS